MFLWVKKLMLAVVLAVMPLQGIAASLSVLQCPPAPAAATDAPDSDDGGVPERDGNAVKYFSEHFFCHQLHSGIPVAPAKAAIPDLPAFEPSISLLSSLFIPKQPQPPPLV